MWCTIFSMCHVLCHNSMCACALWTKHNICRITRIKQNGIHRPSESDKSCIWCSYECVLKQAIHFLKIDFKLLLCVLTDWAKEIAFTVSFHVNQIWSNEIDGLIRAPNTVDIYIFCWAVSISCYTLLVLLNRGYFFLSETVMMLVNDTITQKLTSHASMTQSQSQSKPKLTITIHFLVHDEVLLHRFDEIIWTKRDNMNNLRFFRRFSDFLWITIA